MMLTLTTIFASSFVIALSGALMPGPLLTVTVSESTRRGARAGPMMILGHGILELTLVVALLAGLAPFSNRDEVFIVIALVGGIILMWMAVSMFRSLPGLSLDLDARRGKTEPDGGRDSVQPCQSLLDHLVGIHRARLYPAVQSSSVFWEWLHSLPAIFWLIWSGMPSFPSGWPREETISATGCTGG